MVIITHGRTSWRQIVHTVIDMFKKNKIIIIINNVTPKP